MDCKATQSTVGVKDESIITEDYEQKKEKMFEYSNQRAVAEQDRMKEMDADSVRWHYNLRYLQWESRAIGDKQHIEKLECSLNHAEYVSELRRNKINLLTIENEKLNKEKIKLNEEEI